MRKSLWVLGLAFAVAACSSSGVLQVGPGTFMVTATGTSPAFTGTENAIKRVYRDAGAFCSAKQQEVDTVNLEKVEQMIGRPGRATLTFKCAAKS